MNLCTNRHRLTNGEKKIMATNGKRGGGGINWELEINRYTLLYRK